jgi:superfamily I DNA/RNA helicase
VLTHRIAYLLRARPGRADEILADHVHPQGRAEMRERVELLVGAAPRGLCG